MNTSILVAVVLATLFAYGQQAEESLQLVHVVCYKLNPLQISLEYLKQYILFIFQFFRHGSRTPEEKHTYPNDPYKLEHFQPMGWGQLTNVSYFICFRKLYNVN